MAFEFDKLDHVKCDQCGGMIETAQVPAEPPVDITCPHCQKPTNIPGKLGTLLITEAIGKGSAGTVYKALDTTLQRWVAVKLLRLGEGEDKKIVEATVAEARALAALNHPNVVHVHTIGMRSGQPFIVMELLLGSGKLNVMLKEGWVADEQRGLEIGLDIAAALKASWNAGLLHRDVKPGNILFNEEGVAKLLDFSVILNENPDEKVVVGTPYYISPEAAKALDVDIRSDLYSLGATLFHLLTGQPPFAGESQRDTMRARFVQRAPDVRSINPVISAPTAAIVARLLEREPDDRYQTHDELIHELQEAAAAYELMPSGTSTVEDELAAIGSAANAPSVPLAIPRERAANASGARTERAARQSEPSASNNTLLFGSIAAGGLIVIGIVIAILTSGDADSGGASSLADDTNQNKRNIFEGTNATNKDDRSDPPGPSTTKDGSSTPAKDSSSSSRDGKKNTGSKDQTAPSKDSSTKDGQKQTQPQTPKKTPQEIFNEALAKWDKSTSHALAQMKAGKRVPWQTSPQLAAVSQGGATMTIDPEAIIHVSGTAPDQDTYTIWLPLDGVDPNRIKAFRLETLPDPDAPQKGSSRSANGNFVLTSVDARFVDQDTNRSFTFADPVASYEQAEFPIAATLDDDDETGWAVYLRAVAPNEAIFPVKALGTTSTKSSTPTIQSPVLAKPHLVVTLKHGSVHKQHTLAHFRVSFTLANDFYLEPSMPTVIATAMLKSNRSRNESAAIKKYFETAIVGDQPYIPPRPRIANKPLADDEGFEVLVFTASKGQIKDDASARAVLEGKDVPKESHRFRTRSINFSDAGKPVGMFPGDEPFPKSKQNDTFKDNFAARIVGYIQIPEAGTWTFVLAADDDARVNMASSQEVVVTGNRAVRFVRRFPNPGNYPVVIDFVENTGAAMLELSAAKGQNIQSPAAFALLGDVANGGLRIKRPDAKTWAALNKIATTKPTGNNPPPTDPKDTLTQSPGKPPEAIKRGVVWLDPHESENKNVYNTFRINDPDARVVIPHIAEWHFWSKPDPPTGKWTATDYNAGGWANGQAVFAIGSVNFRNTVLTEMADNFTGFYARTPFEIDNTERIGKLELRVRTSDPMIVYLNGEEAARTDGLKGSGDTAKAQGVSALTGIQVFDLTAKMGSLKKGTNWLAIEAHNIPTKNDKRFNIDPILVAREQRIMKEGKKGTKPKGWTGGDLTTYEFDDAFVLEPIKGKKNPRIVKKGVKIEINRRGDVYLVAMVRFDNEAEGKCLIKAASKEPGKTAVVNLTGESVRPVVPGHWQLHPILIDTKDRRVTIESFEIYPPKQYSRMEIKWIGYTRTGRVNPKRPVPGQFWNFEK